MKRFYTSSDIEELSRQNVRELVITEEDVLTSPAEELAGKLGLSIRRGNAGRPSDGVDRVRPPVREVTRAAGALPSQGAYQGSKPAGCLGGNSPDQAKPAACEAGQTNGFQASPSSSALRSTTDRAVERISEMLSMNVRAR